MKLPAEVEEIISTLESHGYEAYAVGGCVRDCMLGKEPHDWDITTSALPMEVKGLFKRTFDTGIEHGTVTVLLQGQGYEVTTYRIDGEYMDGRHPSQVTFTASLEEDLKRRDFTINAMAYNHSRGLVDLYGGEEDLKRGLVRAVGQPRERFTEDALRMLRALRFSAQLGFEIEEDTLRAIRELAHTLKKISAERIQVELVKLLTSDHPDRLRLACETGLTAVFMPEFDTMMTCGQNNKHHIYSVGEHTLHAIEEVEPDRILRLTMLFHDVGKPKSKTTDQEGQDHFKGHPLLGAEMAKDILHRLKFDNYTIAAVANLVACHDDRPAVNARNIRRLMIRVGDENMENLLKVKRADTLAQSLYHRQEKLDYIEDIRGTVEEIRAHQDCLRIKDLKISGRDLIALGLPQGKQIGEVLSSLFEEVVENPHLNEREYLLEKSRQLIQSK